MSGPRFQLERGEVRFSDEERASLLRRHVQRMFVWREVWDEEAGETVEKPIPLAAAVCEECNEPWEGYGCSTVRALARLGIEERTVKERERRIDELTEALTPRFGVGRLREPGNRTVELRMLVDEYTLMYGRLPLVEATFRRMHDHWRKWFKDVGDLARVRADHAYALTLDSNRYTWLTQQFDPWSATFKRPGAPWDETAASLSGEP